MYSYGCPHMAEQKQDDQFEQTYSSYVRIQDVALKTSQRWWTIGKGGERGSGISVPGAWHDDDEDDDDDTFKHNVCQVKLNRLIDFNGVPTHLGFLYAKTFGDCLHYTFSFTFVQFFQKRF